MIKKVLSSCYGQVILGPPGSGKTTYCHKAFEILSKSRKTVIINLDPANEGGYKLNKLNLIDIRSLITCEDASIACHLGPNASFLFCLEFLETEYGSTWLLNEILKFDKNTYFIIDLPGQVELVTHHMSVRNVISFLTDKQGMRLIAIHLVDSTFATDGQKFVSIAMLSLSTMMRLELPHINVLSKMDLISQDDLDFPLEFYKEAPNFSMLAKTIKGPEKTRKLMESVCELLDDYGQVAFQFISTKENQEESMIILLETCDRVINYIPSSRE